MAYIADYLGFLGFLGLLSSPSYLRPPSPLSPPSSPSPPNTNTPSQKNSGIFFNLFLHYIRKTKKSFIEKESFGIKIIIRLIFCAIALLCVVRMKNI